jgi:hypothetical protein
MKKLIKSIAGFCILACASVGMAATVIPTTNYIPNMKLDTVVTATGGYTNATVTPTVIPGTSFTLGATQGDYTRQYFRVCYTADVTKSTSTTGAISIYLNGVNSGSTMDRYVASSAGRNSIGGCFTIARPSASAQTIALYGTSGDTASFAVTNAVVEYWRVILN